MTATLTGPETATAVTWTQTYGTAVPVTPQNAADARACIDEELFRRLVPDPVIDRVCAVAYHLVHNAARWGNGPVRATVVIERAGVRVFVHDHGRPDGFGPDRHGLTIVKAFSESFEVIPDEWGNGKTVRALVPHRPEAGQ